MRESQVLDSFDLFFSFRYCAWGEGLFRTAAFAENKASSRLQRRASDEFGDQMA